MTNVITWCALSSACDVNTGSNYIWIFASVGKVPAQSHFVKVTGHINTMLVQSNKIKIQVNVA